MLLIALIIISSSAWSFDMEILRNTKEAVSHNLNKKKILELKAHPDAQSAITRQRLLISHVLDDLIESNQVCELSYGRQYYQLSQHKNYKLIVQDLEIARAHNLIDDIMLDLTTSSVKLSLDVAKLEEKKLGRTFEVLGDDIDEKDHRLSAIKEIQTLTDESKSCLTDKWRMFAYHTLKHNDAKKIKNAQQIKFLTKAKKDGLISSYQYALSLMLIKNGINKKKLFLGNYLEITKTAKNIYLLEDVADNDLSTATEKFNTRHFKRLKKISRRKDLYAKYDLDQVLMLSQIMQDMNIRMSMENYIENPSINLEYRYTDTRTGKEVVENTPLNYEDQINWARRMLLQDMTRLQNSEEFKYSYITYEDIITAALETGVINLDEVSYVLTYDDLWNPDTKPWDRIKNYIFALGGTVTIFLPPPYNILGSLALVLIQTQIEMKNRDHRDNKHANKVIN
jgi:hypothetical protein